MAMHVHKEFQGHPRPIRAKVCTQPDRSDQDQSQPLVCWRILTLSELQCGQSDQGAQNTKNVKTCNHLGLVPSLLFEVMVQRSHKKNALSRSTRPFGVFKPASLEHNRYCFRDEDPSGDKKDERLMDQNSHDSERPSQSERACIPHEYLRRMTI